MTGSFLRKSRLIVREKAVGGDSTRGLNCAWLCPRCEHQRDQAIVVRHGFATAWRQFKQQFLMNMKPLSYLGSSLAVGAVLVAGSPRVAAQDAGQPPAMPAAELPAGSEVLAGGPVHEAFAKPVSMDPQAPIVVPQQPPANLQEVPPAEQPAGADIVWVPGYWAWDSDRNDFIWVSGCWRNAPPNTYWVPGHWLQISTGWEWIGGVWKPPAAQPPQEIEYWPAPPAPIEVEAPGAPPQPDQVWVPGCWYWEQGHYVQRHGYWIAQQVGWVWVPSHYAWTPRGYIFASGHWDHDMDNRGVLFCPTFFPRTCGCAPASSSRRKYAWTWGCCG